jgi:hypothetical protein
VGISKWESINGSWWRGWVRKQHAERRNESQESEWSNGRRINEQYAESTSQYT